MKLFGVVFVLVSFPLVAKADIYKYKKADGTVIYTDNLSQLPPDLREFYNKQREEREEKRRQMERSFGKDELEKREAEAKKAELQRAQMQENERQARLTAIDNQLKVLQAKDKEREVDHQKWVARMKNARIKLDNNLTAFKKANDDYNAIAIKPSFTLLPGEAEQMEVLKKRIEELEGEVDKSVVEVEVTIPEEARKAGIPPGWIR